MVNQVNYYDILGVSRNATISDIKSAYRDKAKKFHPDINKKTGAEELFGIVQEAYETLSNESKRIEYDATLYDTVFESDNTKHYETNNHQPSSEYEYYEVNHSSKPRFSFLKIIRKIVWFILLVVMPISIYIDTKSFEEIIFYLVGVVLFYFFKKIIAGLMSILAIIFLIFGFFSRDMSFVIGAGILFVISVILILVFCGNEIEEN